MTCTDFQRWLDDGRPGTNDHAANCARCEHDLRAAIEVERLLAMPVAAAVSAGFDDAVFRTIHAKAGWRRVLDACVHVLAEPLVPIALALLLVVAIAAAPVADRVMQAVSGMTVAHALAVAPLILLVSWRIFRAVAVSVTR